MDNLEFLRKILDRALGPVSRNRNILYIDNDGIREVIEAIEDATEINQDGGIETVVKKPAFFYSGCGHYADSNMGGRCECGATSCSACYLLCVKCGTGTCPKHRVMYDEGPLCLPCYTEVSRSRRVKKCLGVAASLFVEIPKNKKKELSDE